VRVWRLGRGKPPPPPPLPTGEKIAFSASFAIYTMNTDGTGQLSLGAGTLPDWHPSAPRIAYANDLCIWVMEGNGTNPTRITTSGPYGPPGYVSDDTAPDWSPDGTKILFSRGISGGGISLWIADLTQSPVDVTQLWPPTDPDDPNYDSVPWEHDHMWWPKWSPDGSFIAADGQADGGTSVPYETWLIDMTGPAPVKSAPITDMRYLNWNPANPRELAFCRDGIVAPRGIYAATVDTSTNPPTLTNVRTVVTGYGVRPTWSPDGSYIAYTDAGAGGIKDIFRIPALGGSPTNLTNTRNKAEFTPDWSVSY
jgi:TolB protein